MRLLLASDHYPPFIGGAHVQTQVLAHELARRGHEVAVAAPWQRGIPAREVEAGVQVHRLRQLRTVVDRTVPAGVQQHQPPFADPVTTVALRRLVRRFRPDLVHSHGWFGYACVAALAGTEVPLLLSSRDYGYGCPKRTLLYGRAVCSGPAPRKCAGCAGDHYGRAKGWMATAGVLGSRPALRRRTAAVHSVSTFVQQQIHRDFLQGPAPQIVEDVIPEAVREPDPGTVPPAVEADLARLPAEPYILFVGALRHEKGVQELLDAYASLEDPPPLVLIGTLERDTPPAFPPGAVVLPDFEHGAVLRAWDRALFGVFPSLLAEPLGTVVCEAMTRGKAVIGTRPGGHEDPIEHDVTGLLVPRGDVPELAAAMRRLLQEPGLRERLGRAARERARSFSTDAVVTRFEALYERVARR